MVQERHHRIRTEDSTTQRLEGNGYVSVQFIRDLGSDEIFTSPLSYGVAPFMTSLAERTNVLAAAGADAGQARRCA